MNGLSFVLNEYKLDDDEHHNKDKSLVHRWDNASGRAGTTKENLLVILFMMELLDRICEPDTHQAKRWYKPYLQWLETMWKGYRPLCAAILTGTGKHSPLTFLTSSRCHSDM